MIVHLCCIVKDEELYIEDWMLYYYNLGVDFIYIYNNDNDKTILPNLLYKSNKLKDFTYNFIIIPWINNQNDAYRHCWNRFSKDFDWLILNDIDEYIDLNGCSNGFFKKLKNEEILETDYEKYTNIKQLLEHYKDSKLLSLKWIIYDDNDLIERDMSKTVFETFTRKNNKTDDKSYKSIFNKNLIKKFDTNAGHGLIENKWYTNPINNKETRNTDKIKYDVLENEPFIRHIITYSLKEYLDQKYRRIFFDNSKHFIHYNLLNVRYFCYNNKTEEKLKYIKEYKRKNNITKIIYICSKDIYNKLFKTFDNRICLILNYNKQKMEANFDDFQKYISDILQEFDQFIFLYDN